MMIRVTIIPVKRKKKAIATYDSYLLSSLEFSRSYASSDWKNSLLLSSVHPRVDTVT